MPYIVQLEKGVWAADVEGDPGRTLDKVNAQRFDTIDDAYQAIDDARKYRPFAGVSIEDLPSPF